MRPQGPAEGRGRARISLRPMGGPVKCRAPAVRCPAVTEPVGLSCLVLARRIVRPLPHWRHLCTSMPTETVARGTACARMPLRRSTISVTTRQSSYFMRGNPPTSHARPRPAHRPARSRRCHGRREPAPHRRRGQIDRRPDGGVHQGYAVQGRSGRAIGARRGRPAAAGRAPGHRAGHTSWFVVKHRRAPAKAPPSAASWAGRSSPSSSASPPAPTRNPGWSRQRSPAIHEPRTVHFPPRQRIASRGLFVMHLAISECIRT